MSSYLTDRRSILGSQYERVKSRCAVFSDAQWELIAPLMPDSSGKAGRRFRDHRLVTEGIVYRYRAVIPWRDLPEHFGPWQTVRKRRRRYASDGTWDKVLASLLTRADTADLINWEVTGHPVRQTRPHVQIGRRPAGRRHLERSTGIGKHALAVLALLVAGRHIADARRAVGEGVALQHRTLR
jgi:transposase